MHRHDIDPNKDLVKVIISDKTLKHAFHHFVQQSSPGSENLVRRSAMHVVLQRVPEVADNSILE